MELEGEIQIFGDRAYLIVDRKTSWDYYERPANFDFSLLESEEPERRFHCRPDACDYRNDRVARARRVIDQTKVYNVTASDGLIEADCRTLYFSDASQSLADRRVR